VSFALHSQFIFFFFGFWFLVFVIRATMHLLTVRLHLCDGLERGIGLLARACQAVELAEQAD
jgi:hypothetical protein